MRTCSQAAAAGSPPPPSTSPRTPAAAGARSGWHILKDENSRIHCTQHCIALHSTGHYNVYTAEARSSPGPRFPLIARLLERHTRRRPAHRGAKARSSVGPRQRSAHRDRLGRAQPLSVSARALAGIGDERSTEPRGSTARCGRRLLSCWAVAPTEWAGG